MQHSHLVQSSAFSEMFPGRKPLPVQRHSMKAYLILSGALLSLGAGLARLWAVGLWARESEREREWVRREREKESEAFIEDPQVHHLCQPWKTMCPLLLSSVCSTPPVYLSVSLYSSFSHRSYQIPITAGPQDTLWQTEPLNNEETCQMIQDFGFELQERISFIFFLYLKK